MGEREGTNSWKTLALILKDNHEATVGSGLAMGAHLACTPGPSHEATVASAPDEAGAPEGYS